MSVIRLCAPSVIRVFASAALVAAMTLPVSAVTPALQAQQQAADESTTEPERPSAATLADLLEDEASRERLIDDLRRMAAASDRAADTPETASAATSLPERIAATSQAMASQVVGQFEQALAALKSIGTGPAVDWGAVGRDGWNLGLLILGTGAVFHLLRAFARWPFAWISGWALAARGAAGILRRFWGVVLGC